MYRRKDGFHARAKVEGYRSRAAYKLIELAEGARLFSRGDRVLELGAWPGGWLQVAAHAVGPAGRVIGVDVQSIDRLREANVTTIAGDVTDPSLLQRVVEACEGELDVVLSDLAPKLSGVRDRDDAQMQALADAVIQFAERLLRPGGRLVIKLFTSESVPRYLARLRLLFEDLRLTRPRATRKESAEIYLVAKGFRGIAQPR